MQSLYYLLGLGVGAGLVVQVGMNSTLRAIFGSPVMAALISFLVGSLALACLVGVSRTHHFGWLGFAQHPLTLLRVAGGALLLGGVLLITR
jgi:transporter family-2 protein